MKNKRKNGTVNERNTKEMKNIKVPQKFLFRKKNHTRIKQKKKNYFLQNILLKIEKKFEICSNQFYKKK